MKRFSQIGVFLLILVLAGCTSFSSAPPPPPNKRPYFKIADPIQCVPYARGVSGIPIRGNAHTWWRQAEGRYHRSAKPKEGAVMVLSKTSRLKYGHVAVVKRVVDSRKIEVTHANWGGDRETRRVIYERMPVIDVSANNDWSKARFWHYPSQTYGRVYSVSGFVYPKGSASLAAASDIVTPEVLTIPKPPLKPLR